MQPASRRQYARAGCTIAANKGTIAAPPRAAPLYIHKLRALTTKMIPTPRVRKSDVDSIVFEAQSRRRQETAVPQATKLGTAKGVFVPTLQNIMGIILFVRVPFIVGQAGILEGLGIIWLSCATALLTCLLYTSPSPRDS